MTYQFETVMDSIADIAHVFRVEIFENKQATSKGIVIAIGSGLLMATMDALSPSASVGIEYDRAKRNNPYFADFLALAANWATYVCVHAWFSITKPTALINVLEVVPENKLMWKSNEDLYRGVRCDNFTDLINCVAKKIICHETKTIYHD